jgi:hypothetical protein
MLSTARIVCAAIALVIVAALGIWIFRQGGEHVKISIERQNNEAGDRSDRARGDYDLCVDGGGVYDFGAGRCVGAAPGGRH